MNNTQQNTIETLLAPISNKHPTGSNLRHDASSTSIYYQIKDMRNAARTEERYYAQGDNNDNGRAKWQQVKKLAETIIAKHSKDLEIVAWYIEALARTDQINGLTQGFKLTQQLIDNYWAQLYPELDEDGDSSKVAAFTGLNGMENPGSLIRPLTQIPLVTNTSLGDLALWQYQQALDIHISRRDTELLHDNTITMDDIRGALDSSNKQQLESQKQHIANCLSAFAELQKSFTEKCADNAPPSSFIKNALIEVQDHINMLLSDIAEASPEPEPQVFQNEEMTTNTVSKTTVDNTQTRNHVLASLQQAANYFKETEPHSPIPYMIERTIQWAKLSFPELLQVIIKDSNTKENLTDLIGVTIPNEK